MKSAGTIASGGTESTNAVVFGAVTIADGGDDSITTVTVNGYATVSTLASDVLETLTLKNSATDAVFTVTNTTADSALALNVDNITTTGTAEIDLDGSAGKVTNLTINATGAASEFILTASGVTDLTIDAAKNLTLSTGSDIDASENITIKGIGAVNLGDISGAVALDSFNASANTGGVTATIETEIAGGAITGSITEYIFSEGNDVVTLLNDVIETKVTLGAGNDTLKLATATGIADVVATLNGGTGTNIIDMDAADAETLSGDATFEGKMSNFSKLSIRAATGQEVVDLANMDDMSYVITAGSSGTVGDKQVVTLTDAAAKNAGTTKYEAGDIITVTVNGFKLNYTVVAADVDADDTDLNIAIAAAINADSILSTMVTAASTDANVITLTAKQSGVGIVASMAFSYDKSADGTDTFTAATTTANGVMDGLTLDNMANDGTLEITAAGAVTVTMTDATGGADTFNIVTKVAADVYAGGVTVNDVETIDITATDTTPINTTTGAATINTSGLALYADAATTVNVDGNAHLVLVTSASTLETINATAMTGNLTYVASLADLVVNAGSGADALTAAANDVALNGGTGNDTLTFDSGLRVHLNGGAGNDTFVINGLSALDSYAIIDNINAGDTIKMTGATSFKQAAITLSVGADETLLNYANQAVSVVATNEMGWFQKGDNTYIVTDLDGNATFTAGTDMIVMITGRVDLSTASYNATSNTIEIA